MKRILNDNLVGKVLKTFIEGFLASFMVTLPTINSFGDLDIMKNMFIGALAMGISAVLNLIQEYLHGKSIRD